MKNNLYLIVGEDQELINFYLNKIMKEIGLDEEKKINYDMNTSSISDILDEVSMISLFSSEKVVIGYNFDIGKINDSDRDYLIRYLNNNNSNDRYIILIAGKVDGRSKDYKIFKDKFKIIDLLQVDNGKDIYKYVEDYIKDRGYKIDKYNLDYLVELLGNDINNINNEIAKFIGKKEFYVKKMIERLYNYTVDDLCMMIDKLGIIDREYKSGKSNIDMLELYLLGK